MNIIFKKVLTYSISFAIAFSLTCSAKKPISIQKNMGENIDSKIQLEDIKQNLSFFIKTKILPFLKQINETAEIKEKTFLPLLLKNIEKFAQDKNIDIKVLKQSLIGLLGLTGLMFPNSLKLGLYYILVTRAWPVLMIVQKGWGSKISLLGSRIKITATAWYERLKLA